MYVFLPFLVVLSRLQNKEMGHSYEQLDETLKDVRQDRELGKNLSASSKKCSALYREPQLLKWRKLWKGGHHDRTFPSWIERFLSRIPKSITVQGNFQWFRICVNVVDADVLSYHVTPFWETCFSSLDPWISTQTAFEPFWFGWFTELSYSNFDANSVAIGITSFKAMLCFPPKCTLCFTLT